MDPRIELKQLDGERADLLKKANDGAMTPREITRADEVVKRIGELSALIAQREAATKALKAAGLGVEGTAAPAAPGSPEAEMGMDDGASPFANGHGTLLTKRASGSISGFTRAIGKAVKAADETFGGVSKALAPSGALTFTYDGPIVAEPRPAFWLANALARVPADTPTGAYLRQSARQNNAAPVPIGGEKPTSVYGFSSDTWRVATIAHMSEPIPKQWLADFPGLLTALSGELGYGLAEALEAFILNGGEAEDGTEVTGILNDPGIGTVAYSTDKLVTLRKAIGALERIGVQPTAFALNPDDWTEIELMREDGATGKYMYGSGPQERPARQVWGVPVILVNGLPAGECLIGDFSTVGLIVRGNYELTWSQQGTYTEVVENVASQRDLMSTNKVRFRSEARYGLEVTQPVALRKVDLTA